MQRHQIHRIQVIHEALVAHRRRGGRVTAQDLVLAINDRLDSMPSVKTVRRDLGVMRDELNLPVEWHAAEQTFRYRESAQLADITLDILSSVEVCALLVARQGLEQYQGTPWHGPLKKTFDRILGAMASGVLESFAELIKRIRFAGPQTQSVDWEVWQHVIQALDGKETMRILYRSGRDGQARMRLLDPYGLVIVERQWQLIGRDHDAKAVRTFLLQRVSKTELTGDNYVVEAGFDLDHYLETGVAGQQSTGDPVRVKLRFTEEGTPAGEAQTWHRHETRTFDRRKRLIVEFETAALFKVEREVLAWGGKCEVLEPRDLKSRIRRAANSLLKTNHSG